MLVGLDKDVPEIPSIPSGIQEVIANAQRFVAEVQTNLDIPKLAQDITNTVAGLEQLVNSPSTQNATQEFNTTLASIRTSLNNIDRAVSNLDREIDPVASSLIEALEQADRVLEAAENQLRDDSDLAYRLGLTLKEIESAARAIRILAEQLDQQPESIIKGKQ